MKDALKKLVEFLFNGHASSVDSVTKDILDFSAGTSQVVSDISDFAVMPVALTVLAIVMMVELNRKASHIEADHQTGVKLIAAVIFKYIILVMAVKNSGILLNAIRALVANVMGDPHLDPEGAGVSVNENGAAVSAFQASIDKASSVDQVGMLIFLLIPFLVTRPVVAGAGRVGIGPRSQRPGFQISQRADYVGCDIGLQTTFNRCASRKSTCSPLSPPCPSPSWATTRPSPSALPS